MIERRRGASTARVGYERRLPEDAAAFLREQLGEGWSAKSLFGDAGTRVYFRVSRPDGSSAMLAYYPEEARWQLRRYLDTYAAIAPHTRPPGVLSHSDCAVLQHDVGNQTLLEILTEDPEEGLRMYRKAIDLLVAFQQSEGGGINPPFAAKSFFDEMQMSRDYFFERLLGLPPERAVGLLALFERLSEKLSQHSYVLCHRDFHGQNLLVNNDDIYVLDFQDMRLGPDTYDLASLLRDRGVADLLGDEAEMDLLRYYGEQRRADGNLRQRYFETLLQRSIKILGTFSRQPITRGRLHYLDFIPPTLASIRRCVAELPEFAGFAALLPPVFSLPQARERVELLRKESPS